MLHLTFRALRKLVTENFNSFASIKFRDFDEEECDIYDFSQLYKVLKILASKSRQANHAQFFIHKD